MTKQELLLLALSAGGRHEHSPVQVQKLLFLIEKNIGESLGGPVFDFKPYDYGPFDSSIYDCLRKLKQEGLADATATPRGWDKYALNDEGLAKGVCIANNLDAKLVDYISKLSSFVRTLSFADLVSAVYKAHPEMQVNSVFRGA